MRECTIASLQVVANASDARRINRAGGDLKTAQSGSYLGNEKHEPSDVWPQLVRLGVQTGVPGGNLFYLHSAMNYLVWYHLFEAMKPGWYRRTNETMKREQGRTMIGYKPYAPIPHVPPQLNLGG